MKKKPIHRGTLCVFDMLALIGYEFLFIRLGQIYGEIGGKKTIFVVFATIRIVKKERKVREE